MTVTDAQVQEVLRIFRDKRQVKVQRDGRSSVDYEGAMREALTQVFGDSGDEKNIPILTLVVKQETDT